jgi:glycosyltransferase involved in cell wall biosynthesis
MNVAFVEPHLELYGGVRRIIELANRLTARGVETTIYHPAGTPCEWMSCMATVRATRNLLGERHDVLIYNDPNAENFAVVKHAGARLKVFYVLELHKMDLLAGFHPMIYLPRNRRTLYVRRSLRAPYLKLVNATWLQGWLRERMRIESIAVVGGINLEMFHPVEIAKPRGEFRVLCSGDPRERKGTAAIMRAAEIARREVSNLVLDTYHGMGIPQERMAEKYASAHLFAEGSTQAGWNNPVAEAMACRTPVVCTAIGGVQDFAFHEKTALLVPPRDSKAMAAAIVRMARDEALRGRLVENAYHRIRMFNWDETAERLELVLRSELAAREVEK